MHRVWRQERSDRCLAMDVHVAGTTKGSASHWNKHGTNHLVGNKRGKHIGAQPILLGRHVCRTKLPPKRFKIDMRNCFAIREKGSEKRSETCPKLFKSGGAKLRISALRFCIFRAQWNLAIFLGIVPLNFRENQGKDTICKMLKLQAWKSQNLTSENLNLTSPN